MATTKITLFPLLNLQLFADGVGSTGGSEGTNGVDVSVPSSQNNSVVVGNADGDVTDPNATGEDVPDRNAEFEKLIKGDYKDLYDARVQETIQKRLKNTTPIVDKYNKLSPTLELLSQKYGVDASDVDALTKAIEEDDTYYEDEALERGITVEQLKEIKKMERENADLRKEMEARSRQEEADKLYSRWMTESESTKAVYPSFDLEAEMENPKFRSLLSNNIDVKTAFEVIHKDDIIPAAMQYSAQQTKQAMSKSIMANAKRPMENGLNNNSPAVIKADVSKMTKEQRAELCARARRGETIRF